MIDYPEVGPRKSYLIYHEEEESLVKHIKGLKQIRFWMTFSDNYIKHLDVLQSVGMTRIDPVMYKGNPVIPMEFLKELLPPPSSLGKNYTGKTSIGVIFTGTGKNGKPRRTMIYNVCEHQHAYKDTGAQAVSYTTGVPPVVGAMMLFKGHWGPKAGVLQRRAIAVETVHGRNRQARPALADHGPQKSRSERPVRGEDLSESHPHPHVTC